MQEKELTYKFKISEKTWELLLSLNGDYKYAEYRDAEYDTLEDFKSSDEFKEGRRTEEWFLNRNHNGTLSLMRELNVHGLVENDYDSWHMAYVISNLGKEVIKQNQ